VSCRGIVSDGPPAPHPGLPGIAPPPTTAPPPVGWSTHPSRGTSRMCGGTRGA